MDMPSLTFPGTFVNLPDHAQCQDCQRLIAVMESAFTDAILALRFFRGASASLAASVASGTEGTVEPSECPTCGSPALPDHLQRRLPFLYARTFLFALDSFAKALKLVANIPGVPASVAQERDAFESSLPSLTPLRDTAHHVEDRARGLAKGGKPLNLKPVVNEIFHFPGGGVLALDILNGDKYGATAGDGSYMEIAVSTSTLATVRACFQAVIDALPWRGRPRQCP